MGKKRKIISLIVSVAMLVAMLPMIVHADEAPGTFADLQADIADAEENMGGYLSLSRDYIAADSACSCAPLSWRTRPPYSATGPATKG